MVAIKALSVVPLCEAHVPRLYHRKYLKDWLKRPDYSKCPFLLQSGARGHADALCAAESGVFLWSLCKASTSTTGR